MYAELKEYLLLYNKLPFPGLGSFVIQRTPAVGDFPNRIIHAPHYVVQWNAGMESSSERLWSWLSHFHGISLHEARHKLEMFLYQMKASLDKGDTIEWKGVGVLHPGTGGQFLFSPATPFVTPAAVPANKVLREKAEHIVKVGEDERTAVQMTEILNERPARKFRGWLITGGIITLVAAGFIAWYLGQHDWNLDSLSNQQAAVPSEAAASLYTQP